MPSRSSKAAEAAAAAADAARRAQAVRQQLAQDLRDGVFRCALRARWCLVQSGMILAVSCPRMPVPVPAAASARHAQAAPGPPTPLPPVAAARRPPHRACTIPAAYTLEEFAAGACKPFPEHQLKVRLAARPGRSAGTLLACAAAPAACAIL